MSLQQSILLCSDIAQNVTSRLCATDVFFLLECGNQSLNVILRKYVKYYNVLYRQDMKLFSFFMKFFFALKHIYIEPGLDLMQRHVLPKTLETFIAPRSLIYRCVFGDNITRVEAAFTINCTFKSNSEIMYSRARFDRHVTEIKSNLPARKVDSLIRSSNIYPSRLSAIQFDRCPEPHAQREATIMGIPVIYKCEKIMSCGSGRVPHCTHCGKIAKTADVLHMGDYHSFANFEGVRMMKVHIRGPADVLLLQTLPQSVKRLIIYQSIDYKGLWKVVFKAIPSTVTDLIFKRPVPVWETVVACPPTVERLILKESSITSKVLLKLISTNYDKLMLRELKVHIINVQRKTMKKINSYKRISIN